jgi:2-polyprenyl-3-methyl-5-hydroxy-6-metoxy-1,4-benzoquinol methylase
MSELNYLGPPHEERFKKGQELDRSRDTSQLRFETFKHQPHKDYLGHVFRWGFVGRFVGRGSRILDVGCGQDLPLLRSLGGASRTTVPELYVGVDVNPIKESDAPLRKWAHVYSGISLEAFSTELDLLHGPFNLVACLEVYEHVAPHLALDLLGTIKELMSPDGVLLLSTPVYSHRFKMARNHVNERTKAEMEDDLHRAGFKIICQHGTFGNFNDLKKMLGEDELDSLAQQRKFYGDEVMGCYLAPRFPEASRNVTHVCLLAENDLTSECELVESVVT